MSGLEIYSGKFKYEGTNEEYQGELQIDSLKKKYLENVRRLR